LIVGLGTASLLLVSSGVGRPTVSNGPLVFESTRSGNPDIYLTTDGRSAKRLTSDPAQDTTPTFSPNGKEVAFASDRTGDWQLYRMNADGSGQQLIKVNAPTPFAPRWSPAGDLIAFQSFDAKGTSAVYVVDVSGGNERRLSPAGVDDTSPSWSPKGDRVVLSRGTKGRYGLVIVDVATGKPTTLTAPGADFEPAFSPSGTRVAFSRMDARGNYDVYVMPAKPLARQTRLTTDLAEDGGPAWSPDELQIAFRTSRKGIYALWVMSSKGTRQRPLVRSPSGAVDVAVDWAPATQGMRVPAARPLAAGSASGFFCVAPYLGTNGDNTINGSGTPNNICGLGGVDRLRGLAGNDQIDGGSGNDRVLVSGVWSDGLMGGDGDDIIYGRAHSSPIGDCDYVNGGNGPDTAWVDKYVKCSSTTPRDSWTSISVVRPP